MTTRNMLIDGKIETLQNVIKSIQAMIDSYNSLRDEE